MTQRHVLYSFLAIGFAFSLAAVPPAMAKEWLYTVRPGDTLWDLADAYLLENAYWRRLQTLNKVADPQGMPPGSRLRIPVEWLRTQPSPARIIAAEGPASLRSSGGQAVAPAAVDMLVHPGDELTTEAEGSVTVEFADGSILRVGAGSHIIFDILSVAGGNAFVDTRVRLLKGNSSMQVRPSREGAASRSEIWTPAALSAVRGTDFRVGVLEANEGARTEVLGGQVAVSARARTVALDPGFGTVVDPGAAPRPPRQLLPPPGLTDVPAAIERVPVRIRVSEVKGAAAYRLEIARDAAFTQVVADRVASSPTINGPDLADDAYFLRVRAIDPLGLEGFDATRAFVLNARPEPPFLIEPSEGGVVPDGLPQFRWSEPEEAAAYRLQLAAGDDFATPLADSGRLGTARFSVTAALPPGSYRWRVATIDKKGEQGPFSDAQRFRVPEPGPIPEAPEGSDETMIFRWPAGEAGDRYRFQMARDKEFQDIMVDEEVSEPQVSLARPDAAAVFIRVQTLGASGEASAFGTPQRIEMPSSSPWLLSAPVLGLILVLLLL